MDSILTTVKAGLGIMEEYEHFDEILVTNINTVLAILTQMGVGDEEGFSIEDDGATWDDFIGDSPINHKLVQTYVIQKTRMIFDPPQGSLKDALDSSIKELEWRINSQADYMD